MAENHLKESNLGSVAENVAVGGVKGGTDPTLIQADGKVLVGLPLRMRSHFYLVKQLIIKNSGGLT
jgi:hypothetical protein